MKKKTHVYVLFVDYGQYEGCSTPYAVVTEETIADMWRRAGGDVTELDLDDLSDALPSKGGSYHSMKEKFRNLLNEAS